MRSRAARAGPGRPRSRSRRKAGARPAAARPARAGATRSCRGERPEPPALVASLRGRRHQPYGHGSDDTERALRADDELAQVGAGRRRRCAAEFEVVLRGRDGQSDDHLAGPAATPRSATRHRRSPGPSGAGRARPRRRSSHATASRHPRPRCLPRTAPRPPGAARNCAAPPPPRRGRPAARPGPVHPRRRRHASAAGPVWTCPGVRVAGRGRHRHRRQAHHVPEDGRRRRRPGRPTGRPTFRSAVALTGRAVVAVAQRWTHARGR